MYELELAGSVEKELRRMRAFDRGRVLDAIEEQFSHEPARETRNRKMLLSLVPAFEAVPPVWELRVGDYRVFYDVDEEDRKVYVRAVRKKLPHQATEDIL